MTLTRSWLLSVVAVVAAFAAVVALPGGRAEAHPLGNFTVNRYSGIELYSDVIRVNYVLDLAEVPAFQEFGAVDANGDGDISSTESEAYSASKGREIADNLMLSLDSNEAPLTVVASGLTFPAGQAGLDTLRLALVLEAQASSRGELSYSDSNYGDRLGWKEIVVTKSPGLVLGTGAPTTDASQALTQYPDDLLSSALDITSVAFSFDATGAAAAPPIDGAALTVAPAEAPARSGSGLASLIDTEHLTPFVIALALLAAFGFGAVHALEPGHGKTLVAAYFVGVKGGARQALTLGGIIAVTHTVGVLAIGAVTLYASRWILPENLYPWLSLASGLMILMLGLRLIASRGGLAWAHGILHRVLPHHHHHHAPAPGADGPPPWRSIVALGLADGLTPSPSALVVLLAAVSLDRLALGLGLVISFSIGLAAVLAAVSLALVYAREIGDSLAARFASSRGLAGRLGALTGGDAVLVRVAPLGGACALVVAGTFLTLRALAGTGIGIL